MNSTKTYPEHVAIIMDGNGRWAKKRKKMRSVGHKAGVDALEKLINYAQEHVKCLTLFAFSSENWKRPKAEVQTLFKLLESLVNKGDSIFNEKGISLEVIGDLTALPSALVTKITDLEERTQCNTKLKLVVAINYGGKWDIVQAANKCLENGKEISCETLESYLTTSNYPKIDLMIRTGGEQRLSNFLLWQMAYTELYFTPTLWPDFSIDDFYLALDAYANRHRRFGGL